MNPNNASEVHGKSIFGIGGANSSNPTMDSRYDESSSSMFVPKMGTSAAGNDFKPKDGEIGRMLAILHLEWSQHEVERNRWVVERAEYDSKIAILEGRIKSYANINSELLQRIKMLEAALLIARSQEKFNNESIIPDTTQQYFNEYVAPQKVFHTNEQSKRGRHLLQQYLKEIKIIEDTIKTKNVTDSKIAEFISRTPSETMSEISIPRNDLKNLKPGLDSVNYSKTYGHPDSKKNKSPISPFERNKFLDDMKKGLKHSAQDRIKNTMNHGGGILKDSDAGTDNIDHSVYNQASNLFDMIKSLGNNASPVNNTANNFDPNEDHFISLSDYPNNIPNALIPSNYAGGVVRKKSNRMKMDMLNFKEEEFTGTALPSKKIDDKPSFVNIFSNQNPNDQSQDDQNINEKFDAKLDVIAKRFKISGIEMPSDFSDFSDLSDLSDDYSHSNSLQSITTQSTLVSDVSKSNSLDTSLDDDLGILNDIDEMIEMADESTLTSNIIESEQALAQNSTKRWNTSDMFRGHTDSVTCVNFHPSEKLVASSSYDGLICVWKFDSQKKSSDPMSFLHGHEFPVLYCLFNNTGDCLYSSDTCGNIFVWNVADSCEILQHYQAHHEAIWYMSHNNSTNTLLSASADGVCSFWKPDSLEAVGTFNINSSGDTNINSNCGIISADFSPLDHSKIVISAGNSVYLYDVNQESTVFTLRNGDESISTNSSSSGQIQCSSLHPQNHIYGTGWGNNQVKIVDLKSGEFIKSFTAHPAPITAISFGSTCSGTYLATGGANGSIHIWNQNYTCYQDLPPHRIKHHSGINSLVFHKRFPFLASGGADELVKLYI